MSLVKHFLLEKKLFEAQEEIDKFIEDSDIEEGSVAQRLEFDKSVFTEKEQVDDFLKAHFFSTHIDEDDSKKYVVELFDEIAFVESTMKSVEIREGIMIVVGILRPMSADNPALFTDTSGNTIKLSAELPYIIELATVVTGFHANFGKVELTKKDLKSFKDNFENRVTGVDTAIDFDHETREAAGWIKEVFLSFDEETLLGVIRWTPKGALALSDREFRYYSPEFSLNWIHPHTGAEHGPTLLGGALVNRPFLKMDAIVGLNEKTKGVKEMSETISLSDHNTKVSGFEKQISDMKLSENTLKIKFDNSEVENKKLSDELKGLKVTMIKAEKEAGHKMLFDDGKINKAQLDALNEGKDVVAVLGLAEKMNNKPAGDGGDNPATLQLSDKELAMCKQLDLTPEEYVEHNKEGA